MNEYKSSCWIRIIVLITYLVMIVVNALANILPLNGQTTGQVASAYPNLFAPSGYTFTIWGLIYLLLSIYTLYQLELFQKNKSNNISILFDNIGLYFFVSSLANIIWIFAWHFNLIALSLWMIVIILICLILINQITSKAKLSQRDKIFIRLPFSIYFGWITIATIANVTTLLVSLGWNGWGIKESTWTIMVILLGLVIAVVTIFRNKDIAYGLVIIWAYCGILYKHLSYSGFNGQYPFIITTVIISLVVLFIVVSFTFFLNRKEE